MAFESDQFGRSLVLEFGDILKVESTSIEDRPHRVKFAVERDKSEIPNNLELAVWNLSDDQRKAIEQAKQLVCRLKAGYGPDPKQLFVGVVTIAKSFRERGAGDWILRASAGDGQNEYASAKVSLSWSKGTPVTTVLAKLVAATGLGEGNVKQLTDLALASGATEIETPYVAHGSAIFELQLFADSLGLDWSFQDGQFVGAKAGEPYNSDGPLLSLETGLQTAQLDELGNVRGTALLHPDMLPGVGFRVEHPDVTGDYVCVSSVHEGDTYDEQLWNVHFDGIPLGATSDGLFPPKAEEKKPPTAASIVGI